jgi:hypothetical protein
MSKQPTQNYLLGGLISGVGTLGSLFGGDEGSDATTQVTLPPYMDRGMRDTVNQIRDAADRPFAPYTQQRFADFTPDELAAQAGIRGMGATYDPYMQSGLGALGQLQQWGTTGPDAGLIEGYMNPFISNVLDVQQARAQEDFAKQRRDTMGRMGQIGSFGGSRAGFETAQLYDDYRQRQDEMDAKLLMQGYDRALSGAERGLAAAADPSRISGFQGADLQRFGALGVSGAQQRALDQNRLDFAYDEFLREEAYPRLTAGFQAQNIQPLASVLAGGQQTINERDGSSALGSIIGGIGSFVSDNPFGWFNEGGLAKFNYGGMSYPPEIGGQSYPMVGQQSYATAGMGGGFVQPRSYGFLQPSGVVRESEDSDVIGTITELLSDDDKLEELESKTEENPLLTDVKEAEDARSIFDKLLDYLGNIGYHGPDVELPPASRGYNQNEGGIAGVDGYFRGGRLRNDIGRMRGALGRGVDRNRRGMPLYGPHATFDTRTFTPNPNRGLDFVMPGPPMRTPPTRTPYTGGGLGGLRGGSGPVPYDPSGEGFYRPTKQLLRNEGGLAFLRGRTVAMGDPRVIEEEGGLNTLYQNAQYSPKISERKFYPENLLNDWPGNTDAPLDPLHKQFGLDNTITGEGGMERPRGGMEDMLAPDTPEGYPVDIAPGSLSKGNLDEASMFTNFMSGVALVARKYGIVPAKKAPVLAYDYFTKSKKDFKEKYNVNEEQYKLLDAEAEQVVESNYLKPQQFSEGMMENEGLARTLQSEAASAKAGRDQDMAFQSMLGRVAEGKDLSTSEKAIQALTPRQQIEQSLLKRLNDRQPLETTQAAAGKPMQAAAVKDEKSFLEQMTKYDENFRKDLLKAYEHTEADKERAMGEWFRGLAGSKGNFFQGLADASGARSGYLDKVKTDYFNKILKSYEASNQRMQALSGAAGVDVQRDQLGLGQDQLQFQREKLGVDTAMKQLDQDIEMYKAMQSAGYQEAAGLYQMALADKTMLEMELAPYKLMIDYKKAVADLIAAENKAGGITQNEITKHALKITELKLNNPTGSWRSEGKTTEEVFAESLQEAKAIIANSEKYLSKMNPTEEDFKITDVTPKQ